MFPNEKQWSLEAVQRSLSRYHTEIPLEGMPSWFPRPWLYSTLTRVARSSLLNKVHARYCPLFFFLNFIFPGKCFILAKLCSFQFQAIFFKELSYFSSRKNPISPKFLNINDNLSFNFSYLYWIIVKNLVLLYSTKFLPHITCYLYTESPTHLVLITRSKSKCLTMIMKQMNKCINILLAAHNHLSGCFCLFGPKFWEGGRYLQMVLYHSINAVWVVGTLKPYLL